MKSFSRCGWLLAVLCLSLGCTHRHAQVNVVKGYAAAPVFPDQGSAVGVNAAWFAHHKQGVPYCWGGKGPRCYDCSGLTQAAWKSAGILIPRTSREQRAKLEHVPMTELMAGDILWRPGHVGIYVGNGWAVHAPGRGKPVRYQAAWRYREAMRP